MVILISRLSVLVFLSVFVNGAVMNDGNLEVIALNESQYCFVNQNTIRISDNFTSELQDIVNKTEHVIISTTINSTVIFIAPSNGTKCNGKKIDSISKGLFIILMVIYVATILVAIINIILHLVFKELRTMAGVLVMMLCSIVIMTTVVLIISLTYSFIKDGSENSTACVVSASMLYYLILVYQANKVVIQFQFAYLMYKSYQLQSQDTIDKRRLMINFVIFALVSSILCFLSAILIDLAVTGKFYSKRDSLCFGRQFDLDAVSVFRVVSLAESALFVLLEIIVFSIGLTLYFLVSKSCCKTISTNFRIAIALATTIGVSIILLTILYAIEVSANNTIPAVSSGTLIEQVFLFILFASSSKVRNGVRKMSLSKKRSSTSIIRSRKSTKEQNNDGVYKELRIPLVAVS
ncbi:uncharacterized protein [Dysidea avara]|uniref:uncharacterized protein n=1 Tax=Dysidea avara TaxID=196820 RepID=UPI00331AF156